MFRWWLLTVVGRYKVGHTVATTVKLECDPGPTGGGAALAGYRARRPPSAPGDPSERITERRRRMLDMDR